MLYDVRAHKRAITSEISSLKQESNDLRDAATSFGGSFAKERIAREQLLMKREDETVYFIR